MRLRHYCVTVMDNWSPTKEFWTFGAALAYAAKHGHASHLFVWHGPAKVWHELQRVWLTNIHDR